MPQRLENTSYIDTTKKFTSNYTNFYSNAFIFTSLLSSMHPMGSCNFFCL